jgi:hypothetical protein
MGYTHYLYRKPHLNPAHYTAFAAEAKVLLTTIEQILQRDHGTGLAGWDGSGSPQIDTEHVAFNGAAPADYETCRIDRDFDPDRITTRDDVGRVFTFCKTAEKPYDAAVTAVYALAVDHFGDAVVVDSDGGPEAIEAGRALASRLLGRTLRAAA